MAEAAVAKLVSLAAARYRSAGLSPYCFARGKLQGDRVFATLLARGLVPDGAHILDLGCGQGLLAAWLAAAQQLSAAGAWPAAWPGPPRPASYRGVDRNALEIARATQALETLAMGMQVQFEVGDIRAASLGSVDTVVLLDVLHYLEPDDQPALLQRIGAALPASGRLLLRVGDAQGGLRFHCSRLVDTAVLALRGYPGARLHCRTLPAWLALLGHAGFSAQAVSMPAQASAANVLLLATRLPGA
jgi:SAM-dependent methyltransferase